MANRNDEARERLLNLAVAINNAGLVRREGTAETGWAREILEIAEALTPRPEPAEAMGGEVGLVDEFDGRFRSGNSVPIDRIWLTRDMWQRLRAALARPEPAGRVEEGAAIYAHLTARYVQGNWAHPDGDRITGWRLPRDAPELLDRALTMALPCEFAEVLAAHAPQEGAE